MDSEKKTYSKLYSTLFLLILGLGTFLRIYALGKVPGGYQMDEAYGAFNAYSLFHSGIDSAGHSFPVYFEAWGGGQNALNSYLMLPLLALSRGKMNLYVVRLPQVFVAIATLVAVFYLMKYLEGTTTGLWAMLLVSICPWHVMMSRWGLESNLAPGFLILGLCFFAYGLEKPRLLILSGICYGLSLYCYATIWVVVPLLLVLEWGFGFWTKALKVTRFFVIHVFIIFCMAFPLMAFLLVNKGIIPEFSIGPFSVYRMTELRDNELAHGISSIMANIDNVILVFRKQNVGRPYDVIMPFGFFGQTARYIVVFGGIIFLLVLIYMLIRRKKPLSILILFQLMGAAVLGCLVKVEMTQINCVYIPLLLCGALGISYATKALHYGWLKKVFSMALLALLLIETYQFQMVYHSSYKEMVSAYFQEGSEKAVKFAMEQARSKNCEIQVEDALKYPSVLLFAEVDAGEYLSHVEYSECRPKPASFVGKGITFRLGIDWEDIDTSRVYVFYEADKDKFREFRLQQFHYWYVAY